MTADIRGSAATYDELVKALRALTRAIERHNKAMGCEGFVEKAVENARSLLTRLQEPT